VATNLAHALYKAGHVINQVVSRNKERAKQLASNFGAYFGTELSQLYNDSDFIIICVNDDAYAEVIASIPLGIKGVICHTSGSVNMNVLESYGLEFGVFYPLQSLTKEKQVDFLEIPIFVEGSTTSVKKKLYDLADSISTRVTEVSSKDRLRYHLAAVFSNNFTNLMYSISEDYLKQHKLEFKNLLPLIEETALRLKSNSPASLQTGPAKRKDTRVINHHLELLDNSEYKEIYEKLSNFLMTKS